jgi:hypothetical protein
MQYEITFSLVKEIKPMKITKLITRSSIALLALCSTSAFAGVAFLGPDYTVHKANVNLTISYGLAGKIEKEKVRTNEFIDLLVLGPVPDGAELAMAVPCDVGDVLVVDPDVIALFVAFITPKKRPLPNGRWGANSQPSIDEDVRRERNIGHFTHEVAFFLAA